MSSHPLDQCCGEVCHQCPTCLDALAQQAAKTNNAVALCTKCTRLIRPLLVSRLPAARIHDTGNKLSIKP